MMALLPLDDESPASVDAAVGARCLRELREHLQSTFPVVDARGLVAVLRRHGLTEFPPGFLVAGSIRNRSSTGPVAKLRTANARGGGARTDWHPLFSGSFYELMNPDVAAAGISPWLHYQARGRLEGRTPHPFIDLDVLQASATDVRRADLLDHYLSDPALRFADPSPYVDIGGFVVTGDWDGTSHPLVQLAEHGADGPWISRRLLAVDAAATSPDGARLVAAAFVLTRSGASRLGRVRFAASATATSADAPGRYTVIPGHTLARDESELLLIGPDVVSGDSSAVRTAEGTVLLETGNELRAPFLIVMTGHASHAALAALVTSAVGATVVAPASRAQEIALRQLRRDRGTPDVTVLAHGVQAHVDAGRIERVDGVPPAVATGGLTTVAEPRDTAIVIPVAQRRRSTGEAAFRALLAAGAALCLVDSEGLNTWLPVIQSRGALLVDDSLVADVASFVDEQRIRTLAPWRQR